MQPKNYNISDLAGEAAVLGSMLIDPRCIPDVISKIDTPDVFFHAEHRIIYTEIISLYIRNSGEGVDGLLLRTGLTDNKQIAQAGGVEYLAKLMNTVPSSANVRYYLNNIIEKHKFRQLITMRERIDSVLDGICPVSEKIEQIQSLAMGIEPIDIKADFINVNIAPQIAETIHKKHDNVIRTGLEAIDRKIHGLEPGDLIIIAGRPAMGKSGLALDIALRIVPRPCPALYISLEMEGRLMIERAICNMASIDLDRAVKGELSDVELARLKRHALDLSYCNLLFTTKATTPAKVIAYVRRLKQTHYIQCVFIDYLQLMSLGEKAENRQQEITAISRKLKLAAQSEHIPFVVLSQLNRGPEGRQDKRPLMSDIRESGSIEQDADKILLLHREDYYNERKSGYEPTGICEIDIAKNRNGKTGRVEVEFIKDFVKFQDKPHDENRTRALI